MLQKSNFVSADDWRSQLDSKYDEYDDLIQKTASLKNSDSMHEINYAEVDIGVKNQILDALRFPPFSPVLIPATLISKDFEPDIDQLISFDQRRASAASSDAFAGLEFLEAMFQTVVGKAINIRDGLIENGNYIYSVGKPPSEEENDYIKSTITDNLITLRDESLQLMTEMAVFDPEKIDEMMHGEASSYRDLVLSLKTSLIQRSLTLKNEIAQSAIVIDGLLHFSNSVIGLPDEVICKLDGFQVDWSAVNKIRPKSYPTYKSLNFESYMKSFGYRVCGSIFEFLNSSKSYANSLIVIDYNFQPGELKTIFDFFAIQHYQTRVRNKRNFLIFEENKKEKNSNIWVDKLELNFHKIISIFDSIHELVFCNCEFNDRDMHTLAQVFPRFKYLHSLNLSDNMISDSGVTSFATAVIEHKNQFPLRSLKLDKNLITQEGAKLISQILFKFPFLEFLNLTGNHIGNIGLFYILKETMNPRRKAFKTLIKPEEPPKLNDNYEDDDDEEELIEGENEINMSDLEDEMIFARRKKFYKKCYFVDYFKSKLRERQRKKEKNNSSRRNSIDGDSDSESEEEEQEEWVNDEEDEFLMETKSEYSVEQSTIDESTFNPNSFAGSYGRESGENEEKDEVLDILREAWEKKIEVEEEEIISVTASYPKLVRRLLKIRLKLAAVSAFLGFRARSRGILSALQVANCGLTNQVISSLVQMLKDNRTVTFLDVSFHPELLSNPTDYKMIGELILHGSLRTLKLNNCGLSDKGIMVLTQAACGINPHKNPKPDLNALNPPASPMKIMKTSTICNLELSDNFVGPTGANWIATATKDFNLDSLTLTGGFYSSAPFPNFAKNKILDEYLDENEGVLALNKEELSSKGLIEDNTYFTGEEEEDDGSFIDLDLYDGEEFEVEEEVLSQNNESKEENTYFTSDQDDEDENETAMDETVVTENTKNPKKKKEKKTWRQRLSIL